MVGVGVGAHHLVPLGLRRGHLLPVARERGAGGAAGLQQRLQGQPRVAHQRHRALLEGVHRAHVDGDETYSRMVEQALRRGDEVAQAGADGDDQVRFFGDARGSGGALHPMAAQRPLRGAAQRALAGVGLAHRNAERGRHGRERVPCLRVVDPAAGDDQGPAGAPQQRRRLGDAVRGRRAPLDAPRALGEEVARIVIGVRLNVLRQGEGHGAGVGRIGKHPHRLRQRREELLRAGDAVEEAAHRPEAVVDADVAGGGMLQLLQHRPLAAGGVVVGGQQQHRHAVDGGGSRAGHHVGRAGTDGAGARQRLGAARGAREPGRGMHHRLLVAGLIVGQRAPALLQGLPQTAHVAMAEDAEHGRYQPPPGAVQLAVLNRQVLHHRLPHGEAFRFLTAGQALRLRHAPLPAGR